VRRRSSWFFPQPPPFSSLLLRSAAPPSVTSLLEKPRAIRSVLFPKVPRRHRLILSSAGATVPRRHVPDCLISLLFSFGVVLGLATAKSAVRKECAPVPALHCDFLSSLLLKYCVSRAPGQSPDYSPAASAEGAGSYGRSMPSDQPELAQRVSVLSGV
jgi:hypothetical protein